MRVSVILVGSSLILLPVGGRSQMDLRSRLQVAAVVQFPDGRNVWTAREWPQSASTPFAGELYTAETLCTFQSDLLDPTRPRSYGWAFRASVGATEVGANQLAVRLEWRRTAPVSAVDVWKSRTLNLEVGQAVAVDKLIPGPVPDGYYCDAIGMELMIRLCGGPRDPCASFP